MRGVGIDPTYRCATVGIPTVLVIRPEGRHGWRTNRGPDGYADFLMGWFCSPATGASLREPGPPRRISGTRNIVWQNWHLTSFPRTSSGTERIFRQRRLGQINWQGIARASP